MPGSQSLRAPLPSPLELFVRIAVVTAALLVLAQVFRRELVTVMIPTIRTLLDLISDDFTILGIGIGQSGTSEALQIRFNLARVVVINGRAAYPMGWTPATAGWMQVSVTLGSITQHVLMLLIVVIAWPAATLREFNTRLIAALPMSATLLLIDVPVTILAEFWFPIRNELDQDGFWPLLAWSRFLMGGGGLMLAMGMAIVSVATGRRYGTSAMTAADNQLRQR